MFKLKLSVRWPSRGWANGGWPSVPDTHLIVYYMDVCYQLDLGSRSPPPLSTPPPPIIHTTLTVMRTSMSRRARVFRLTG